MYAYIYSLVINERMNILYNHLIMGRRTNIHKKVLEATEGVCGSVVDAALLITFFSFGLFLRPPAARTLHKARAEAEGMILDINYREIKRAMYRAREKGWLKPKELKLTKDGEDRLRGMLPKNDNVPHWDGKWHITLFDIPEKERGKRNVLRAFLKRLGFGKLFESTWISPFPFLGQVDQFIKSHHLQSQVVLSVSDRVGTDGSRDLANRIWKLDELNQSYKDFLNGKKIPQSKLIFQYLAIAQRDPRLPKELLPIDWKGERAFEYYQELIGAFKIKRSNNLIK